MNGVRNIPFFDYPALFAEREDQFLDVIGDVLKRGAYIMQRDLREFEGALARYLGVKYVIGTADGTMALIMGLMALGIGPGDEVIVPSHTFVASAASIKHVGATPILADCGPDHLIDIGSIPPLLNSKTRAIMPVQLNGRTADMDRLFNLAKKNSLLIIEDACQALGSKYDGQCAGTFGHIGAFSFFPSKTLGCFGDGGALVTNDESVFEQVLLLRDHGRRPDGDVWRFGFNARLDNLQAAILNFKLKSYDLDIARRRELAAVYHSRLDRLSELRLPPAPDEDPNRFDIYQNYEIEATHRDELRTFLADRGVHTIVQWGGYTLHQFKKLGLKGLTPYTERMTKEYMLLPMNTSLEVEDVEYVCEVILEFYHSA